MYFCLIYQAYSNNKRLKCNFTKNLFNFLKTCHTIIYIYIYIYIYKLIICYKFQFEIRKYYVIINFKKTFQRVHNLALYYQAITCNIFTCTLKLHRKEQVTDIKVHAYFYTDIQKQFNASDNKQDESIEYYTFSRPLVTYTLLYGLLYVQRHIKLVHVQPSDQESYRPNKMLITPADVTDQHVHKSKNIAPSTEQLS